MASDRYLFSRARLPALSSFKRGKKAGYLEQQPGRAFFNLDHEPSLLEMPELEGIKSTAGYFRTTEGHMLRYAHLRPEESSKAAVFFSPGKSETLHCYARLGVALAKRGYDVSVLEPASQGGSVRFDRDPHKVHAKSFKKHGDNLAEFIDAKGTETGKAAILVAHSMTAAPIIPGLAEDQFAVDGFMALAPMIEAVKLPTRGPQAQAFRAAARFMVSIGLGKQYAAGEGRFNDHPITQTNPYTDCLDSLASAVDGWGPKSCIATRGVTYAWVAAYYKNADKIAAMGDNSVTIPSDIVLATRDTVVSNEATRHIARVFQHCEVTEIDAKHALPLGGAEVIDAIAGRVERLAGLISPRTRKKPPLALIN